MEIKVDMGKLLMEKATLQDTELVEARIEKVELKIECPKEVVIKEDFYEAVIKLSFRVEEVLVTAS